MRAVLICPPLPSHLRAFEALAQELTRRGHQAIFLTEPGTASRARAAPTVCAATAWRSCAACRPT